MTDMPLSDMRWILNGRRTRAFRAHVAFVSDDFLTVYNEVKEELQAFSTKTGDAVVWLTGEPGWKGVPPRLVAFDDPGALRLAHETYVAGLSAGVSTAMRAFNDGVTRESQAALMEATRIFSEAALALMDGAAPPAHLLDPNHRD